MNLRDLPTFVGPLVLEGFYRHNFLNDTGFCFHSEWLVGEASSDDEDGCGRLQVPGEIKAESIPSLMANVIGEIISGEIIY